MNEMPLFRVPIGSVTFKLDNVKYVRTNMVYFLACNNNQGITEQRLKAIGDITEEQIVSEGWSIVVMNVDGSVHMMDYFETVTIA